MLGSKLFFGRTNSPRPTEGAAAQPSAEAAPRTEATADSFDAGRAGASTGTAHTKPERSGSWMGGLVGRLQKAAAGALIGAMALGALGTGSALAAETPVAEPEAAVVQTADAHVAPATHVVRSGDTMWGISKQHGVPLADLVRLNPHIDEPSKIRPGDLIDLRAPATDSVRVRPGDSMWRIAKRIGVSPASLIAANPQVSEPSLIQPGQVLRVPQATTDTAKAPTPAASAGATATNPPSLGTLPSTGGITLPPAPPTAPVPDEVPQVGDAAVESRPSPLGKLWREVRKLSFDLLADHDVDQDKTFALGRGFEAGLAFEGAFLDSASGNWQRMAFERALPEGKDALWLRAEGTATLDGAHDGEVVDAKAGLDFSYSMVRPHVFEKKNPDALELAKDFSRNAYRLPFSHEAAARLEQGSQFTLRALAELEADGKLSFGTVDAEADANYEIDVRREGGSEVEVTWRRGANLDARLDAKDLRDGRLDVGLGFEFGRDHLSKYQIDLSAPDGQRAYYALLSLQGGLVKDLAEIEGNGVSLLRDDDESDRGVDAKVRHEGTDGVDVTVTAGWDKDRDDGDVTTTLQGGVDVEIDRPDADWEAKVDLDGSRVVSEDETRTRLSGGVQVEHELSEDTDLRLGTTVSSEREVDRRWKTETREGRLAHSGLLTTKVDHGADQALSLGFDAKAEVEYELRVPLGKDPMLPLSAELMRKAPEQTRLTLEGAGTLGVRASQGFEDLDLSAKVSAEGRLEVVAERLDGDRVRVDVELDRELTGEAKAGYRTTTEGGGRYSASISHSAEREADKSASFTLSLDKASHRAAYDALLRGDMGPAVKLLDMPEPSWLRTTGNVQQVKLSAGPVEWFDAGLELTRRDVDPNDSRIKWDTDRNAFSQAAKARGQQVRWIEAEGALAPKVSYTGSAPVGGLVNWRHGFSASKTLRYRAFAPSVDGSAPSLSPAFTAAKALELPRGAEFELMGRGSAKGFTGLGLGTEWGATGVVASLSASADTSHEAGRTWEVEVQRLDGDRVEVSFEKGSDRENAFEIAARAGVKVDSEQLLGLESAVEQLALLSKATDALDDALDKRLALELEASWSKKKAESQRLTFRLDLSRPGAREAYEGLLKLDGAAALTSIERPDSGVEVVRTRESESVERRQHTHFDLFGERLYLRDALRSDETTIERWNGGQRQTDRSRYRRQGENIIGRERDVQWDAVRVRSGDDPVGKGYYRLQYEDEDPLTSKTEVQRLLSLGQDLAAEPVRAPRVDKGARGLAKLFGNWARHGETKLDMDVFFTGKGMDAIRGHDAQSALQVYGEIAAQREGRGAFGWANPDKRDRAIELLEEYLELQDSPFLDDDTPARERSLEVAYWRLTKNEMWEDREAYESAKAFSSMVQRMHDSADPVEWNRAFADLGEAMGFDFYDALATMQRMAGEDEVLVHQMRMKGKAVDIEMKDEGLIRYPS